MIGEPVSMDEFAGHPLRGPLLKLGRAKEHFAALREMCEAFLKSEPYGWRTEFEDYEGGLREYEVYAWVDDEPPIGLGLVAGDVIQNLRAALDQLIWGNSDREKRDAQTAFPIYRTESAYREKAAAKMKGVPDEGRAYIEKWQPFQWGERADNHPLAMLQRLSNTDKHRTMLPVAVARKREYVAGFGEWKIEEIHYDNPSSSELLFEEPRVMTFVTSGEPPNQSIVDAYLTFELAIEGCSLTEFESMILYVQDEIIGAFERDWD
jgi:hypothetical protein